MALPAACHYDATMTSSTAPSSFHAAHLPPGARAPFGEHLRHTRPVGHVHLDERERRMRRQARQPVVLERRIVVIVQIVQADHLIPPREQDLADMHADEAGGAGNEYFHEISRSLLWGRLFSAQCQDSFMSPPPSVGWLPIQGLTETARPTHLAKTLKSISMFHSAP